MPTPSASPPVPVPVRFSLRAPAGARVELVGDFPDFKYPVAMREQPQGHYACELELGPGVYRYKFRLEGRVWVSDPSSRAVDRGEPYHNGLLIVGGTTPPLIFAPDRKHVVLDRRGRLRVQVEVASPAAAPAEVWVKPLGGPRVSAPLRLEADRGGWQLLRAELDLGPGVTGGSFGFAGAPEHVFALPAPRPAHGEAPEWLDGAVFYTILLDRWLRSARSKPHPLARSRRMPSSATTFYGGDLEGVCESLDYLKGLGVDAVVLTPLHPSPTPHRYDSTDLLAVDETLGGEPALRRLVEEAHARDMRIVADLAVTHVNEAHPAFQDVLARQQQSRFASFFRIRRFPVRARDAGTYEHYYDRPELPLLDLREGPARRYALKAALNLVELGVDGLRLDAMNDVPPDFWAELRARVRAKNPELLLSGEVISDNLAPLAEERGVDAATDFKHREAILQFFGRGGMSAAAFWEQTRFDGLRLGPFDPRFRLLFLDTHDTVRFLSVAVLYDRLRLALAYLMLRPEPVALTYGTEAGLASHDPAHVLDDAWPERLPMPPLAAEPNQTQRLLQALSQLRRGLKSSGAGPLRLVSTFERLLIVERRTASGAAVRGYFNAGSLLVAPGAVPENAELALGVNDPASDVHAPLAAGAARLVFCRPDAP